MAAQKPNDGEPRIRIIYRPKYLKFLLRLDRQVRDNLVPILTGIAVGVCLSIAIAFAMWWFSPNDETSDARSRLRARTADRLFVLALFAEHTTKTRQMIEDCREAGNPEGADRLERILDELTIDKFIEITPSLHPIDGKFFTRPGTRCECRELIIEIRLKEWLA